MERSDPVVASETGTFSSSRGSFVHSTRISTTLFSSSFDLKETSPSEALGTFHRLWTVCRTLFLDSFLLRLAVDGQKKIRLRDQLSSKTKRSALAHLENFHIQVSMCRAFDTFEILEDFVLSYGVSNYWRKGARRREMKTPIYVEVFLISFVLIRWLFPTLFAFLVSVFGLLESTVLLYFVIPCLCVTYLVSKSSTLCFVHFLFVFLCSCAAVSDQYVSGGSYLENMSHSIDGTLVDGKGNKIQNFCSSNCEHSQNAKMH